jgi:hypothetical protein
MMIDSVLVFVLTYFQVSGNSGDWERVACGKTTAQVEMTRQARAFIHRSHSANVSRRFLRM